MNRRINYFIFIVFLVFNLCKGKIISSTISKKKVNVLGVEFNYGIINVEFDTPLYKYDQLGCPNYNCTIDAIDCSCDYSDVKECPKESIRDPSCPLCPTVDIHGETICKAINGIERVLKVEKDIKYTIDASEPIQLRYKANSRICEGLMITSYPLEGFYTLSVGHTQGNQRNVIYDYPERYSLVRMCPSDKDLEFAVSDTWTKDTYFINIRPYSGVTGNVTLSFEISSTNVPPAASSPPTCTPHLQTHQCINEGQVVIGNATTGLSYSRYTFNVSKSSTYTIRAPNLAQTIFIMADLFNQFPAFNEKNITYWLSLDESENYLTLYLEAGSVLYISVYSQFQSVFTLSITSAGYKKRVKVTSLPPKASAYYMVGTSVLSFSSSATFQCNSYYLCYPFSNIASFKNNSNPLYPIPSITAQVDGSNLPPFQTINYQDDSNESSIDQNSYQASVVYSYKVGTDVPVTYASFNALLNNSYLVFINTLYDENDNVLTTKNYTSFEYKEYQCDYTDFKQVMKELQDYEDRLYNVTGLDELNSLRYKLDSITSRDSYIGCTEDALQYASVNYSIEPVTSRGCHYNAGTPEYLSSPCCVKTLEYYQCCVAESRSQNVSRYLGVLESLVSNQCSDPSCTNQIFDQYFHSLIASDNCQTSPNTLDNMMSSTLEVLRGCKSVTMTVPCNSDDECKSYAGPNAICDLYYRQCLPDFQYIDKRYLHCVFSQLDQSTVFKVLHKPFHVNDSIIDEIYESHLKEDITNQVFGNRKLFGFISKVLESTVYKSLFYPVDYGLDSSMKLVHDTKYDGFFDFTVQPTDASFSEIFGICPFLNCYDYANSTYPSQCYQQCDLSAYGGGFCGHCAANDTFCFYLGLDQSKCNSDSNSYCLYSQNVAWNEVQPCSNYGYCSVYCDYECKSKASSPICVIPTIETNDLCITITNGQWDTTTSSCYLSNITTSGDCDKSLNQIWVDCKSKNIDECSGPLGRLYDMCYISGITCDTEEDCKNAGSCSDSYYFSTKNAQGYPQGLGLGKCVKKHQILNTHVRCEFNLNGYTEQDSPMGCYSHYPLVSTRLECESLGEDYKWWSPSLNNKTKCLKEIGCSTYHEDSRMLPYNKVFNEMDQETCIGCSDSTGGGWKSKYKWENKFEWTQGYWFKGVSTKGQWITNPKFTYVNRPTKTLDYQKIHDELVDSVKTQMADMLRSEYFCRQQRTKDNLNSVSCSCSGSGGSQCFEDTALLLGQVKPCSSSSQSFSFEYGNIIFTNNSVKEGCGNMLISQYPKNIFTNSQDQHFPSGFVSYPKPDNWGIFNKNLAIIGTLIGDGIKIESQNIQQFTVCFNYDDNQVQNHQKYPIYDLASLDLQSGILFPLNSSIYFGNSSGILQLCSDIQLKDPIINLFPANRINSWRDEMQSYFKSDVRGLLYSLAAFFLVVSAYGFYQLAIVCIIRAKGIILKFELVHLLIFMVFTFVTIRAVYFLVLPNGSLANNQVAEYILVVIPTFFLFSCYSLIIVLWYTIIYLVLRVNSSRNLQQRVYTILGVVNLIIYILLVIVILVFNFTKNTNSNSCGNRIIFEAQRSNSQKAVSYLYAIIQALISLVIAVAFIYLGGSLWIAINKVKSPNSKTPKHQQKIFLLTTICSAGFVLHCIFILICVGLNEPNVAFSFVGLVLTEIIPSATILYCYDQRKSLQLDITLSNKSTQSTQSSGTQSKLSTISDPTSTFSNNLSSEF